MTDYASIKAWRAKQPNIRQIRAAEAKKWRERHPDVYAVIRERYREKHREEIRERDSLEKGR